MNALIFFTIVCVIFCGPCAAQDLTEEEIQAILTNAFNPPDPNPNPSPTPSVPLPCSPFPPPPPSPMTPQYKPPVPTATEDPYPSPAPSYRPLTESNTTVRCDCVPFYQCKDDYGNGVIDIKIPPPLPEDPGYCSHYMDRCCPVEDQLSPQEYTPAPPVIKEPWKCGVRNPEGIGFKIIGDGDHEANYGEFPWMVAVLKEEEIHTNVSIKVMVCGGSIIHPQVVLTGAHCVKGKKSLLIRAGEWDSQTSKEMYPIQERAVAQTIIHEGYYGGALHNDVALLILKAPLESSPVVGTICLPEQGEETDGRHCVSSGWGKDAFGKEGKYQAILKRVELDTVDRETCQEELRKTRLGSVFKLHPSFICAGGKVGQDTCKGDGGGPLVCPSKSDRDTYIQTGIVAWGIGCGTGVPAVYVNLPLFRDWIDFKMESLKSVLSKDNSLVDS